MGFECGVLAIRLPVLSAGFVAPRRDTAADDRVTLPDKV